MDRKNFLSSLCVLGVALPVTRSFPAGLSHSGTMAGASFRIPPYLKPGDTIGITCPAGFITLAETQPSIKLMESWGFRIRLGDTVGKRDFSFGGTDAERAADFQQMLDDPSIQAIMCARGGYGAVRIIDRLNFAGFYEQPKWIIGFSDITVIHSHLNRNCRVASIHSKMCNSFPDDWSKAEPDQVTTILSIRQALAGEKINYIIPAHEQNRMGMGEGILTGGNLKTLETLSGTLSDIDTTGKILFVEDTGEYLYSIDRMFRNLERTGKLSGLKGLIVGGFKIKPDDPGEDFGRTLPEIVLERVKNYDYPVCFGFPLGHQKNNFAVKCGVGYRLDCRPGRVTLGDLSVAS